MPAEEPKKEVVIYVTAKPTNWQEFMVLAKIVFGAFLGYVTARILRTVGVYCLLFFGSEAVLLSVCMASGTIIHRICQPLTHALFCTTGHMSSDTALAVMKYTMPPLNWLATGVKRIMKWEFSGIFNLEGIAFKTSFLMAFGYTMKHGAL